MGYTPLFDSLTKGTLCGRWPDIGLWPIVLSLSDRHGVVDATPTHISALTGLPLAEVVACMNRFCEPDPHSRSMDYDGARLVLLDVSRDWGWSIVNHGRYREKARKQSYDSARTASGLDAERKRQSRDVPTRPATSRSPNGKRKLKQREEKEARTSARNATRLPEDFQLTPERRLVAEAETLPAERTFAKFADYWKAASGAKARKHDWDATWRNWCRSEADRSRGNGGGGQRKTTWVPPEDFDEEAPRATQ